MWASRKQSGVEGIDQEVTSISILWLTFLHYTCIGMPRKGIYKIANHFRKRLCWRGGILECLLEYLP